MFKYIDYIFYLILIITVIGGLVRGFVTEAFNIAAVIFGAVVSYIFADSAALFFCVKFNHPFFLWKIASSIILYGVTYFLIIFISYFINKIISVVQLSFPNRVAGGMFGLFKGLFISYLILLLLNYIPGIATRINASAFQKIYLKISPSVKMPDSEYIKKAVLLAKKLKLTAESKEVREKIIKLASETDASDSAVLTDNLNKIIDDKSFLQKIDDNEWSEVLKNPLLKELMKNEEFARKITGKE